MKKVKIQIRNRWDSILFEYEKENNTIKDSIQEAIKQGINLQGANLYGADLKSADLKNINLESANLYGANLLGANLEITNLRGTDLRYTNLQCTNLCSANLQNAYLLGANLYNANLYNANLYGAYLYSAYFRYANLEGANLGDWGVLKDTSDILIIGQIGSRNDYTTIFHTNKGIFVQCGCFKGSIDEFVSKVKKTHQGNKHERDYMALVEFAKIKFQ